MKNILKTTIFAFLLISLGACTNDKDPVASVNGLVFRDVSEVEPPALLIVENEANVYNITEWDKADYGVQTGAPGIAYVLAISDHDKDPNFTNTVEYSGIGIAIAPERECTLKVGEFNELLNKLPTFNCGQMNIDIRLKSTLGISNNAIVQYSEPITVAVTGYSTAKQILSFASASQSPVDAPKILSSGFKNNNDFEGYIYLEPGDYKLYRPDACGSFASPTIYGSGSGNSIVEGSSSSSISIATAGYYLVKANLSATDASAPGIKALTYSAKYYKAIGIFGLAVRNNPGSANAVPMIVEQNKPNVWKLTIDLFTGRKFRFKSNDWSAPLTGNPPSVPPGAGTSIISILGGSAGNSLVEVTGTSGEITVPGTSDGTKQKFDIIVDVSKPRNYTYSLTLNKN